jgi:hypothetical protein
MVTKKGKPSKTVVSGKPALGRHTAAMINALKGRKDIDGVTQVALLGLATAWDLIEKTGENTHTIPSISRELREIWTYCGLPEADDIFK